MDTNTVVDSFIVLVDGKIWSWKSTRSYRDVEPTSYEKTVLRLTLNDKYLPPTQNYSVEQARHDTWDQARDWMRMWPVHPNHPGMEPY